MCFIDIYLTHYMTDQLSFTCTPLLVGPEGHTIKLITKATAACLFISAATMHINVCKAQTSGVILASSSCQQQLCTRCTARHNCQNLLCTQIHTADGGDVLVHEVTAAAAHADSAARARHARLDAERLGLNGGTASNPARADPAQQSGQAAELQMGNGVHQQPGTSSAAGQSGELPDCRAALRRL